MNRTLITALLAISAIWTTPAHAALPYEESLKQLAEGVTANAVSAKKERLAVLDFTDTDGTITPIGQFLAEELSTQILVAGELKVVDRTLLNVTLKKLKIGQLKPSQTKSAKRAAKMLRADVFVTGSYLESPDEIRVTVKLLSPGTLQSLGAARSTFPKTGPLAERTKEPSAAPVVTMVQPAQTIPPPGVGTHSNDLYALTITALHKQDAQITAELTVENTSARDIKVLCLLQDTRLEDEQGLPWKLEAEHNREGLCARAMELAPKEKSRAVLTFSAPAGHANGNRFILHYRERAPRQDARVTIEGLNATGADAPADSTNAVPPSNQ